MFLSLALLRNSRTGNPSDWLSSLENLLRYLTVCWDAMLMLTVDININASSFWPSNKKVSRCTGYVWAYTDCETAHTYYEDLQNPNWSLYHQPSAKGDQHWCNSMLYCKWPTHASMYGSLGSSLVINLSGTLGTLTRTCLKRTFLLFLCLLYTTQMIQTNN